ncbi:MAG: hypothetical protein MK108_03060 [Mariniblastus sp.]|nr:hypothetical protein [Mariniblastus sp.]
MNNPSKEDLLGYVLGALDADQQQQVQQSIDQDPQIEDELIEIKASLAPLELLESRSGARPGLARRTCESLAILQKTEARESAADSHPDEPALSPASRERSLQQMSPEFATGTLRSRWSLNDLLVGIACAAVMVGLLFPAISYTRYYSNRAGCQENMISLGSAFQSYSDIHDGQFVAIPTSGNCAVTGIFAPTLKAAGLLSDDHLACPGSNREAPVFVPSLQTIEGSRGERLSYYHQIMGGDYGYTMGYYANEQYVAPTDVGRSHFILCADKPSPMNEGFRSSNHGGVGQNCLFEDGHYQFVKGHAYGHDPIYKNDYDMVAAGAHANDSVIGASHNAPTHYKMSLIE